ncbi:MAG: hypothetical protein ACOYNI_07335 [Acidimicrobiia bacterium]
MEQQARKVVEARLELEQLAAAGLDAEGSQVSAQWGRVRAGLDDVARTRLLALLTDPGLENPTERLELVDRATHHAPWRHSVLRHLSVFVNQPELLALLGSVAPATSNQEAQQFFQSALQLEDRAELALEPVRVRMRVPIEEAQRVVHVTLGLSDADAEFVRLHRMEWRVILVGGRINDYHAADPKPVVDAVRNLARSSSAPLHRAAAFLATADARHALRDVPDHDAEALVTDITATFGGSERVRAMAFALAEQIEAIKDPAEGARTARDLLDEASSVGEELGVEYVRSFGHLDASTRHATRDALGTGLEALLRRNEGAWSRRATRRLPGQGTGR